MSHRAPGQAHRQAGERQAGPAKPAFVRALECIGQSDLDAGERNVCRTLLEWWNPITGELWPAVSTIAKRTGMTDNGVRGILLRLETKGVIEYLHKSRGGTARNGAGHTNRMKMILPGWDAAPGNPQPGSGLPSPESGPGATDNPQPRLGLNPQLGAPQPPTGRGATPNLVGLNPQRGWGEPSIHTPIEMNHGTSHGQDAVARAPGQWMDGPEAKPKTLREALVAAGVRGENLDRLAAAKNLTPADVAEELRDVVRGAGVRNNTAVLVRRLADRSGVELKKPRTLDPVSKQVVAQLEEMRRARMRPP